MFEKYCIREYFTIKETILKIEAGKVRCALVLNDRDQVIGVFSEGDVLRAILQGVEIHTPIKNILRPSFYYLKKPDMHKAYQLIKKEAVTLIPVVNESFELESVITMFDVMEHLRYENNNVS
jgi:CBS domain-containing protein